ncbi:MAG TPA: GntR family transcriptional regulator [Longimicrobium sp.]|nr:GntR family transcriptional regulator [Longimicrobium sp.]
MNGEQVERHLRHLITGLLHVGRLRRGVPLPSIRGTAASLGVDHRMVASAYRALETEGLVEIRPGSGVYLANDVCGGMEAPEPAGWLAGVLQEGWNRGVARGDVAGLVARCAASRVCCACVESNEDHMVALAAELEGGFSLEVRPVLVSPAATEAQVPAEALESADLVVTSVFHAAAARAAAARAGKPCVVMQVNLQFAARVAGILGRRGITTVIADPRYSARGTAYLQMTPHRGGVRFIRVDELGDAPEVDLRAESTLVTRAARRLLGLADYHLVEPPPGYVSPESARELFGAIVALGLGSAAGERR